MPGLALNPATVGAASAAATAGFFGKTPSHGDFVRRRLEPGLIDAWDGWLADGMTALGDHLGDGWLDTYLTAPVWRFVLDGGVCGERALAGVMLPSVDRVGRYYPFAVLIDLGGRAAILGTAARASGWFDRVERLALTVLDDGFDLERFDESLAAIGAPPVDHRRVALAEEVVPPAGWRVAGTDDGLVTPVLAALVDGFVSQLVRRGSVWWTRGSDRVSPSLVICDGLPRLSAMTALFDGNWQRWGWRDAGLVDGMRVGIGVGPGEGGARW